MGKFIDSRTIKYAFPFLVLVFAVKTTIGFLVMSPMSPNALWLSSYQGPLRGRLRAQDEVGLRRKARQSELNMEVEPHILRLQAAELGSRLKGTNVYFVGMMGTGKSTVARALADVMGRYIFLDTDSIIEELLGTSVSEVFATDGEEAFRSVESQVLDQVHSYVKTCVATGGGIVTQKNNWGRLHSGMVVWLDMEPKDILARLGEQPEQMAKRPLLAVENPEAQLEAIMENRRPQYAQADVRVELKPEDGVDDVTFNVVNTILEFIESNPPKWQQWKEKAQQAGIEWA